MNLKTAVIKVLQESSKPLHAKDITKQIIQQGLWSTKSKTAVDSVGARLYMDIKNKGKKSDFVKTAPMIFALRTTQPQSKKATTKPSAKPSAKQQGKLTFIAAAEKVLQQFANGKPMHYKDITDMALQHKWLNTSGKTPHATLNAQLVTELKRAKTNDTTCRFTRPSPAHYGLSAWQKQNTELPLKISQHNEKIRQQLHQRLMKLTPQQFEELSGQLLAEMGFESIEVTKYGNDGGIDVRGILQISDVVRIKMAVQVKRWQKNIQRPTVQQVRGSLGTHEQGLIITTSNFSKGAIIDAQQDNKKPVALMNGEQFVNLLINYNLGIQRIPHDLFELADNCQFI